MKVDMNLTGVDGVLDLLKSLPPAIVSKRGGPVRQALRKGAAVIFKSAKANLVAATALKISEDDRYNTQLLEKNLVVTRGKAPTDGSGERYLVRVRRKVYARKGKTVTTLKTAQLLEYGSSKQPAEPWLRPAFNAKAREAINVTISELLRAVDRIVKKHRGK